MLTGLIHLGGLGATIEDFMAAIKRNEGYYPGSLAYRNNNPGNLRPYNSSQPVDANGFRIFPTPEAGEAALRAQIELNISRGLTLDEFFTGKEGVYSGYDKTDPHYAEKVALWTGIDPTLPLSEALGSGGGPLTTGSGSGPVSGSSIGSFFATDKGVLLAAGSVLALLYIFSRRD